MNDYIEPKLGEPFPGEEEAKVLFTKPIFFGQQDVTDEVDRAHSQLDEAFLLLSGLQQPNHPESEEHARECAEADKKDWDQIRALARSLVIAMGVEEILKPVVVPASPEEAALATRLDESFRKLEESNLKVRRLAQDIICILEKPRA